jgi:hypothetical protein
LDIIYLPEARKIFQTNDNPAGISHFPYAAPLPTDNTSIIQLLRTKAIERHDAVTSLKQAPEN